MKKEKMGNTNKKRKRIKNKLTKKEIKVQKALGIYGPTYEEMKKMEDNSILDEGMYLGIKYEISRQRAAPCCYIKIPKLSEYYKGDAVPIKVHGGVTYKNNGWVGWDYAHTEDCIFYRMHYGKRWEVSELIEHCKLAIAQLIELLKEENLIYKNRKWGFNDK